MATDGVTSRCRGCGAKKGENHCAPTKKGAEITDPNHPSNNGKWQDVMDLVKSYAGKSGGGR